VVAQPSISVIATVFDEATNVAGWLDSLLGQTLSAVEIVIVDGGSTDGTVQEIEHWAGSSDVPIVVIVRPGANISQGRNLAIESAIGQIVAVTDAGTRADRQWLERLTAPLMAGDADVASGFFVPRLSSRWERALAATTLPDASDIDGDTFLPSSRSMAFRREWFESGVRYPEWLDYCEDLVWDLSMARAGARFRFVPEATVTFAVRGSLRLFAVQYARYARGDSKAGLFARRHALRYATYAALVGVLWRRRTPEMLLTAVCGSAYVAGPINRLWIRDRRSGTSRCDTLATIPLAVGLRAVGDIAKMAGYPVGLFWRWRQFGRLGWRTTWRRVSPDGVLFRPAATSTGSQPPEVSPAAGSPAELR